MVGICVLSVVADSRCSTCAMARSPLWPTVVIRAGSACARGSALSLSRGFVENRRVHV